MKCYHAKKLLTLFDELEESRREKLADHLSTCEKCSAVAAQYRKLRDMMLSLPVPQEPPGFYNAFRQRIQERSTPEGTRRRERFQVFTGLKRQLKFRYAFAPATAVVILLVSFILWQRDVTSPDRSQSVGTVESLLAAHDYQSLKKEISHGTDIAEMLDDSVAVNVLVASLRNLQRTDKRYGRVGRELVTSLLNIRAQVPAKSRIVPGMRGIVAENREFDFDEVARALHQLTGSGQRLALKDLLSLLHS